MAYLPHLTATGKIKSLKSYIFPNSSKMHISPKFLYSFLTTLLYPPSWSLSHALNISRMRAVYSASDEFRGKGILWYDLDWGELSVEPFSHLFQRDKYLSPRIGHLRLQQLESSPGQDIGHWGKSWKSPVNSQIVSKVKVDISPRILSPKEQRWKNV